MNKLEKARKIAKLSRLLGINEVSRILYGNRLRVLSYHRILEREENFHDMFLSATPKEFEKQIRYLRKRYNVISLKKLVYCLKNRKNLPKNSVLITFDDGYKDFYYNALPVLRKYKIRPVVFLTTNFVGGKLTWWDNLFYSVKNTKEKHLSCSIGKYELKNREEDYLNICLILKGSKEKEKEKIVKEIKKKLKIKVPRALWKDLFMNWEEIKKVSNEVDFEAHTINYYVLSRISLKEAEKEITESKKTIEEKLNKKVYGFAYPNGRKQDFNEEIKRILKENNFICAFTTINGLEDLKDRFEIKRIGIFKSDTLNYFRFKLEGMELVKKVK